MNRLQTHANQLAGWFVECEVAVNADEGALLIRGRHLPEENIIMDGYRLPWKKGVKYWGVNNENALGLSLFCLV